MTCNIWKKRVDDLRLDEWDKILQSIGDAPYWFTLSGGEPFLYPDIVPLTELIMKHCQPGIINIPHNSLIQNVAKKVGQIADICHPSQLIINLSMDGIGEKHDRIRGIKGNFKRFERTLADLLELRKDHPNLSIGIHTVISAFNVHELDEILSYVSNTEVNQFITEMAEERVELDTVGLPISPEQSQYFAALDKLSEYLEKQPYQGVSRVTQAFRLEYYRLVKGILSEQRQVIPCFAGWASAQIYADGSVWPCCVRADPMGNLRETNYDFRVIWSEKNLQAKKIRNSIAAYECHCPLANASYTNMLCSYSTLAKVGGRIGRSYIGKKPGQ
jgi:MoaA/NifB/PqqE/SkfB family radical SAM enzyme